MRGLLHAIFAAALASTAFAQTASPSEAVETSLLAPRVLEARRSVGAGVRLDGVLDDPAWAAAPVGTHFVQTGPHPGAEARLRTEVRVLFDEDALYVAVRAVDGSPPGIQRPLGRRDDEGVSDWIFIELDSRHDHRTAFSFGVNPSGMQVDGVFFNDSDYDTSWNGIWEAAARVDPGGWTVEVRLPFAQLAFTPPEGGGPAEWGFNVYRTNPRTGETSNWSPRLPEVAGVVSRFNTLRLEVPARVRRIELAPYVSGQVTRQPSGSHLRAGLDLNAALTPSVSAIATVLPDFGQVEADPTQLNLTSFELFQEERRPFFTEGTSAFLFDLSAPFTTRDDAFGDEAAFYSRRVGRAPQGAVPTGTRVAELPATTELLGAAKVFGRSADGWRAGILSALTGSASATLTDEGGAERQWPVESMAQSWVAEVGRDSVSGNASASLFGSALHRSDVTGPLAAQLLRNAFTFGGNGRLRFADDTYELRGFIAGSEVNGSAAAIEALGRAPWHDFQRPDAPRLRLDPGATRLGGTAADLRLSRIGGALQWTVLAHAITPGFDTNALGFQRNSDWLLFAGQLTYQRFPPNSWLRSWQVGTDNTGVGWSWGGEPRAATVDGFLWLRFANFWDARLTLQHDFPVLSTEQLRGGPALALPPRETAHLIASTDARRASSLSLDASCWTEPGSHSAAWVVSPSAALRVSRQLAVTLTPSYQDQRLGWEPVASGPEGTAPYLVAGLWQRTLSLTLRADLALSPRFIIQLAAQPFITTGRYGRYAALADPRAPRPADRFTVLAPGALVEQGGTLSTPGLGLTFPRPDGTTRSLLASAVVRWEYAPGSFLTAVWNHQGAAWISGARGGVFSQLDDALTQRGTDVLLLKASYVWAL